MGIDKFKGQQEGPGAEGQGNMAGVEVRLAGRDLNPESLLGQACSPGRGSCSWCPSSDDKQQVLKGNDRPKAT